MCVPRRTMYRQRSAYQLVLPKVKKKNFGTANSSFNNKVKSSWLIFKWHKQKKLWNQTTLAQLPTKTIKVSFLFSFFKKKNCIEDSSYAPSATIYRLLGHNLLKQPMNPDTSFTLRTIFEESVIKFTIISVITICEK